jgi:hypothetical protein
VFGLQRVEEAVFAERYHGMIALSLVVFVAVYGAPDGGGYLPAAEVWADGADRRSAERVARSRARRRNR